MRPLRVIRLKACWRWSKSHDPKVPDIQVHQQSSNSARVLDNPGWLQDVKLAV